MWTSTLRRWATGLVALLAVSFAGPANAQGADVDMDLFYRELAPHGSWIEHERHGYVWSPRVDDPEWRPYTRGHWAWTEEHGWMWVSDESWGWAPYHYGRWALDDDYGWVWVPGTEWGPAWVAWRHSDDHIGWAPLPPEARWGGGSLAFNASYYDSPRWTPVWAFVAPQYMGVRVPIYRHVVPFGRNVTIIGRTRFVAGYGVVGGRIVNRGVDWRVVQRVGRHRITPLRVSVVASHRGWGARAGVVNIYRPRIVTTRTVIRPRVVVRRDQFLRERPRDRLPGARFTRPEPRPDVRPVRGDDGGRRDRDGSRDRDRDGSRDRDGNRDRDRDFERRRNEEPIRRRDEPATRERDRPRAEDPVRRREEPAVRERPRDEPVRRERERNRDDRSNRGEGRPDDRPLVREPARDGARQRREEEPAARPRNRDREERREGRERERRD